jgi:hypothetical protein
MRREELSLWHQTPICQKVPADFQVQLLSFQQYGIQRKGKNYAFKHMGNAKQTAMCVDMPRNYDIDAKGTKEFKNRSTGCEGQSVRVALCANVDSHQLHFYTTIPKN